VALQDNGHAAAAVHEGIGIQGMRERAVKLGGSVVHHAGPLGFTIHLRIPIKREDTTL
jgi:signal transduction histidine kinase